MTVGEAILYIEDIIDKYSTDTVEPSEILSRIKQQALNILDKSSRDLDNDVNWDIASPFIQTIEITSNSDYNDSWLRIVDGYNLIKDKKYPANRQNEISRNPFFKPEDKYPVLQDADGVIGFEPILNGTVGKSKIRVVKRPIFGTDANDPLITNGTVEARQSLYSRVLINTIVSITGTQFNQVMQYEWAKGNKLERDQDETPTYRPQQQQ